MAKIPDKFYKDFSGGIRRDKSPYDLKDNELQRGRNFEIDEGGRIRKRRGSILFGQNGVSSIGKFYHSSHGLFAAAFTNPTVVYKLKNAVNEAALTTASTTIAFEPDGQFDASGTVEINGDPIAYTGGGDSSGTLTGVTGIAANIAAWSPMNQWQTIGTMTGHIGTSGVWFSFLNDRTIILSNESTAASDISTYDGTTIAAVSGEPQGTQFLENFRDRIFTVGRDTNIVYYSNLGDATSWPATVANNSFEIEDDTGEYISGIKQYRKNLLVFKPAALYAYSGSLPIRQLSRYFGIHNDACIQEINGLLYGFGSNGVWVSNGVSFKKIDKPVKEYLKQVIWAINSSSVPISRIKTAQWEDKFIIYINTLSEEPDTLSAINQFSLVYDTKKGSWETIDGMTAPNALGYLTNFRAGGASLLQNRPILLFSDGTNIYRAYENRVMTRQQTGNTGNLKGNDVYSDLLINITNTDITMNVVTKPFDLGLPNYSKQFGYLKVFCEKPQGMHISAIIDDGDPIPLGQCTKRVNRFKFPANTKGTRCTVVIDESSSTQSCVFNGCVFEECVTVNQNVRG